MPQLDGLIGSCLWDWREQSSFIIVLESLLIQLPAPWGESWLEASWLISAVNTPLLETG